MAIYVFDKDTGRLQSWLPGDATCDEQWLLNKTSPFAGLAQPDVLAENNLVAVDGLPALDWTHEWDEKTRTVATVPSREPLPITWPDLVMSLTPDEAVALVDHDDPVVRRFCLAYRYGRQVNLNSEDAREALGLVLSKDRLSSIMSQSRN